MSIRIKIASSPLEVRQILELRHRVFVEEEQLFAPAKDQVIVDLYDALPSTVNFIAIENQEVVGGMRLTGDSPAGMASDQFFDFKPFLPEHSRIASSGMFCVTRPYRGNPRLLTGLIKMAGYWSKSQGYTHVCAPINPLIEPVMLRCGFRRISDVVEAPGGLSILPMVVDLEEITDVFARFVEKQEIGHWVENFEREFYQPGEVIIQKGAPGSRAYVLVSGEVAVLKREDDFEDVLPLGLSPGELFGELALLTDLPRSATVIATDDVDVMTLDRKTFQTQLAQSPQIAMAMLKTLGHQFHKNITENTPA